MQLYCKKCSVIFSEVRCPVCGKRSDAKPAANDMCLLAEKEQMWSSILVDVLDQNGIPCFRQSVLGAGMVIKAGPMFEKIRIYVPYEQFDKAKELMNEVFSEDNEVSFIED